MSSVDLAWLRMDRPTNPMTIVTVLILSQRVKTQAVRDVVAQRLLIFPRFKQYPSSDTISGFWLTDPHFDLARHVHSLILPPRATAKDLHAAASDLASTQLDPRRPMWEMHVIERYRHGSAIIARFHHCYADGVAMLRVLLSLTDPGGATAQTAEVQPHRVHDDSTALPASSISLDRLVPVIDEAVGMAKHIVSSLGDLATTSLQALGHPLSTVQKATAAGLEIAKLATLSDDRSTALKHNLSARKELAWTASLPFSEVHAIAKAHAYTINDVLLSTVAGALGAWLREHQHRTEGVVIRGLIPVNLRRSDDAAELGNRFGLVFANLHVGERNPIARLEATHRDMEALKSSAEPIVSYALLATMGSLLESVETQAIELFTRKASLVVSNVPGPPKALHICGARIDELYFWVPQAGSIGLGLSLLTYNGHVQFGVMADRELIAAPHRLTELFEQQFEQLVLSTLMQL